ncbi:MAG TPA: 2-amino-4-hydroxy-6-hydroxymethyldihydropteridine diphosphokinase [bacterium]
MVYLSLGSNLGDREKYLAQAREALMAEFDWVRFSWVYETEPVDLREQPWFLNQVVELKTDWTPESLLEWVQQLEKKLGRQRDVPKGPRTLDVDILLFDDVVREDPGLTIPHPRLTERRHVLVPLRDLASDLVLPHGGYSVRKALAEVKDHSQVKLYEQS